MMEKLIIILNDFWVNDARNDKKLLVLKNRVSFQILRYWNCSTNQVQPSISSAPAPHLRLHSHQS